MKLNKIKNTAKLLFFASLFFSAGCTKFLEEKDPSNLTPASFYTIPEHADAAVAAIYADTRGLFGGN